MASLLVKEPIYLQLNSQLRRLIASSAIGSKFLTERQICERFEVSRPTANKALSNLVSEGLLEFRKGVGTFVRDRSMNYNLRALVSFTEEALAAGKHPGTQVLQFESLPAKDVLDEVPETLQAGPESTLFYMERLRLVDQMPVILEKRYVVAAHCPDLTPAEVGGSLYAVWTQRYRLTIEAASERIRAVNIRGADARVLHLRDGAAGMLIKSVGYIAARQPLWSERTFYRGDAYEFHNWSGGVQPAGHVKGEFLNPVESPV